MHPRGGGHQRQAQPGAWPPLRGYQPVEAAQHRLALTLRDAGAIIGHHQRAAMAERQPHHPRAMQHRIVQQIGQRLPQQRGIALHHNAGRDAGLKRAPRLLGHGAIGLGHGGGQGREVHGGEAGAPRTALHSGNPQQGGEAGQHGIEITNRRLDHRRIDPGCRRRRRRLQPLAQMRQRRAQVMRDVVRHLPLRRHQGLDAAEQEVDGGTQPVKFIALGVAGQAARQVAIHDGAGGSAGLRQSGLQPARRQQPQQQCECSGHQGGDGGAAGQGRGRLLHRRQITRHDQVHAAGQHQAQCAQRAARRLQRGIAAQEGRRRRHRASNDLPALGL